MDDLPIEDILRVAKDAGASNVRVFGSRARGAARRDSDQELEALREAVKKLSS